MRLVAIEKSSDVVFEGIELFPKVVEVSTFCTSIVLVRYLPVDESTMCTTTIGVVMRESSGKALVPITSTLGG